MPLDPVALKIALDSSQLPFQLSYHPSTSSTQDDARRLVHAHGARNWLVVAGEQTTGRGRAGRLWITGPEDIAASIVWPTTLPPERWGKIALLGGLAIAQSIRDLTGLQPSVKWPNDVFLGEAKVAGCLGEVLTVGGAQIAILGIGINMATPTLEGKIEAPLYPVAGLGEGGGVIAREALLVQIAATLWDRREWPAHHHDAPFLEWWRSLSLTRGGSVRVGLPDGTHVEGDSVSLAPNGALIIVDAAGIHHTIVAGDLSVTRRAEPPVSAPPV